MPEDNVATVRRLYEGFGGRNRTGVRDDLVELFTDDVRWYPALLGGGSLEGAVYEGHEGVRRFLAQAGEVWSSLTVEPVEFRELDRARVP